MGLEKGGNPQIVRARNTPAVLPNTSSAPVQWVNRLTTDLS